jgi:hypothetical protein
MAVAVKKTTTPAKTTVKAAPVQTAAQKAAAAKAAAATKAAALKKKAQAQALAKRNESDAKDIRAPRMAALPPGVDPGVARQQLANAQMARNADIASKPGVAGRPGAPILKNDMPGDYSSMMGQMTRGPVVATPPPPKPVAVAPKPAAVAPAPVVHAPVAAAPVAAPQQRFSDVNMRQRLNSGAPNPFYKGPSSFGNIPSLSGGANPFGAPTKTSSFGKISNPFGFGSGSTGFSGFRATRGSDK